MSRGTLPEIPGVTPMAKIRNRQETAQNAGEVTTKVYHHTDRLFGGILSGTTRKTHSKPEHWHVFQFADFADAWAYIQDHEADRWNDNTHNYDKGWLGADRDGFFRLMEQGWEEGADKIAAARDGIEAALPSKVKLAKYSVAGAVPNVARAISGNPLAMRAMVRREQTSCPIVTLVCDLAVPGHVDAGDILDQCAAVAAVVDILEERGYRCELYVSLTGQQGDRAWTFICRAKEAGQPLNLNSAAFVIGHSAMLRALTFGCVSTTKACEPLTSTLGSPCKIEAIPGSGVFVAPKADQGYGDPAARFRQVCAALREQGCPGIPELD